MSYHATNSSHVTDHFLSTLLSLLYMHCVACCWKSRLTPAVLYWKVPAACCRDRTPSAAPCFRPGYAPRRTHGMLAHFMARLYIAVVCKITYGSLIPQSTCGSYRIAIFCLISYRIYRFLLWLYRAITSNWRARCTVKLIAATSRD